MIITYSDMTGILGLPIDNAAMQSNIDSLIADTEDDLLLELLGQNEYTLYVETPTDYTELIEGKADMFTYNGIAYKWDGLAKCLKNLVYYRHLTENVAINTEVGMNKMNMQGDAVDVTNKTLSIFNKYIDQYNMALIYISYKLENGSALYSQTSLMAKLKMNSWGL